MEKYGRSGVVVASLTKAAAEEVAGRNTGLPVEAVGTLHAHAYRSLDRPELAESPEAISAWNDLHPAWAVRASGRIDHDDLEIGRDNDEDDGGTALLQEIGTLRARMVDQRLWPIRVVRFAEAWEAWKQHEGLLDFTDLIERAAETVPHAPGNPAVLMLDEAQDLSALEMRLAVRWSQAAQQLVIVGDPDQCIYRWRGSDPAVFVEGDAASERVLAQSYRVPRAVHAYAVDWINRAEDRKRIAYEPRDGDGEVKFLRWHGKDPGRIAEWAEAIEAGKTGMVLASCTYMLQPLVAELRARGVPFHNPYRPKAGHWNPLAGAGRVLAFLRPDAQTWDDEARHWTYGDLWKWMEPMQAEHWNRGFKTFVQSRNRADQFGASFANEPIEPGLLLENVAGGEEMETALVTRNVEWWQSTLLASKARPLAYSCEVARRRGGRALRETPKIVVGTIHSVKGGQADDVILMPDLAKVAGEAWESGGVGRWSIVRTFYVGMTRARERLAILSPGGRDSAPLPRNVAPTP